MIPDGMAIEVLELWDVGTSNNTSKYAERLKFHPTAGRTNKLNFLPSYKPIHAV